MTSLTVSLCNSPHPIYWFPNHVTLPLKYKQNSTIYHLLTATSWTKLSSTSFLRGSFFSPLPFIIGSHRRSQNDFLLKTLQRLDISLRVKVNIFIMDYKVLYDLGPTPLLFFSCLLTTLQLNWPPTIPETFRPRSCCSAFVLPMLSLFGRLFSQYLHGEFPHFLQDVA